MDQKAVVPTENGCPNPFFTFAGHMIEKNPQSLLLMRKIKQLHQSGLTRVQIGQAIGEEARDYFQQLCAVSRVKKTMPPPPPGRVLYGRFSKNASILDIGAGDGKKFSSFTTFLNITANDVVDLVPKGLCKKIITPIVNLLPTDQYFLTSFMTLCQLKPNEQNMILNHDGLHVVPNHRELVVFGAAEKHDGGFNVRAPLRVYRDYNLPETDHKIDLGYGILVGYRERKYNFNFTGPEKKMHGNQAQINAAPISYHDVNLFDVSYKMDGLPRELEVFNNEVSIVNRAGFGHSEQFESALNFCVQYEELEKCLTIIRVVYFGDMVPPHSYGALAAFVRRIKIAVNGKNLCMPPMCDGQAIVLDGDNTHVERTDGIITRMDGNDFYVKYKWTVDFKPDDIERFGTKLKDIKGYSLGVDNVTEGLCEYTMTLSAGKVQLTFVKERTDKKKSTTVDTAIYMMGHHTIPEILTLNKI